jgi:hypothetical protein
MPGAIIKEVESVAIESPIAARPSAGQMGTCAGLLNLEERYGFPAQDREAVGRCGKCWPHWRDWRPVGLPGRGAGAADTSSNAEDATAQAEIRRWFVFAMLKNAFGGSSDTTLSRLRDILKDCTSQSPFPSAELYKASGYRREMRRSALGI